MSAHQNLHDWLREHPEYSLRTKYLKGVCRMAMVASNSWLNHYYDSGKSYEEACYNLLQKLPR